MVGKFSRRHMLKLGAAALGGVLAGCTPEIVKETVVVKQTVEVEKEVEKIVEKEVTKVVEKQVEKVVEKVVTATPVVQKVTVRFMIWGGDAEKNAWNARYKIFQEKHPNILVATMYPPGNYQEKLTAMIASGTAPDVFVPNHIRLDVPRGILLPLDAYIEADPDFHPEDFIPGTLDRGKYQGVQYAIPGGLGPQILFWNVDYFKEAGLENPNDLYAKGQWTPEKFLEYAQKLTKKEGDTYTVFGYMFYGLEQMQFLYQMNAPHFDHPTYTKCLFDDSTKAVWQWAADLINVHHVSPLPEEVGAFGSWAGFRDGKYGMFISGPWQQARLAPSKFNWDIAWPFVANDGVPCMQAGLGGSSVYALTKLPWESYLWAANCESQEGQGIWAGLGFDIPSRQSLIPKYNSGELFTDKAAMPDSVGMWYEVAAVAKPQFNGWILPQTNTVVNTAWGTVKSGEKTAAEAIDEQFIKDVNATMTGV